MEDMLQYFLTQGPFAALFVWMLIHTQKRNKEREDQLYDTLNEFAKRYDIVIEKLDDIKSRLPPR
ncbi:BhlA/UviB family holin-like peptide [Bacillus chungangensis]|uniref:GTP-binding protein EngB required for normal cell division n=1 Tax=Bacillus chungangensis TaxID=587633 RepID=A0ABT9WS75_9BACI|nr:BhlA/UviB family holin-like peptide [Bacillus chungangensis]MDQ0175969.1 GTP-binding protein EngB required for normal cell division [Bacillus chungangensis]